MLNKLKTNNKMTINESINARLNRFNKLWLNAVGHSFEDDEKVQKKNVEREHPKWEEKLKARLKELGYSTKEDYFDWLYEEGTNREYDEQLRDLFRNEPKVNSLYPYEMFCIGQAKNIAEFILAKGEDKAKDTWDTYFKEGESSYDCVMKMQKEGLDWSDDHSGNTAGCSIRFAYMLLFQRDLFPYQHGALSPLVGDEGYHDDRSDIPEIA